MAGPGSFEGPTRYLEWAKPIDLFLQYQVYAESIGQQSCCFTTFRKIMIPIFKGHLKFRDKGEHGQCDVCYRLRARIRKASNKAAKVAATQLYSKHLLSQWLDRQCYWNLRSQSRNYFSSAYHIGRKMEAAAVATSVVAIIQDGMDQAKLRVPRLGYNRPSKAFLKVFRPALHLVATFIHGYKLLITISDEDCKKDSVTSMELVCRGLSELVDCFGQAPLTIHLQQDNTYREGKNTFMLNLMLLLQILGAARFTSLGYLRVAHSHEDVDQAFGQIARLLMGKACKSANDMVAILQDAIDTRPDQNETAGRVRGSIAEVKKLDETSCWKPFVRQTGLKFKGLRHVHYFRFCRRKDLGSDVLDHVLQLEEMGRRVLHENDVFLITKRWLADTEVARAIMVVPADVASEIQRGFHSPHGVAPRRAIAERVKKNLIKHVPPCQKSGELSAEAADYLLRWSNGTLPKIRKPNSYSILMHRHSPEFQQHNHVEGSWNAPRRIKHFDLGLRPDVDHGDSSERSDSGEDDQIDLPDGFDG